MTYKFLAEKDEKKDFEEWIMKESRENSSKYLKSQQDLLNFYTARLNSMITLLNAITLSILAACVAYFNSAKKMPLPNYSYYIAFIMFYCIVLSGLHICLALKKQKWGIEAIHPMLIKSTEYRDKYYVENDILEVQIENINKNNKTLSNIFLNLRRAWVYLLLMPTLSCVFFLIFIGANHFAFHKTFDLIIFISFFLFQVLIYL